MSKAVKCARTIVHLGTVKEEFTMLHGTYAHGVYARVTGFYTSRGTVKMK